MHARALMVSLLSASLILFSGLTVAADQARDQDQVYGRQLMTEQERMEHRDRMRSATSDEEREQIRREHHERMKERARARGVTLPDEPPARGGGKGMGKGMGNGMGKGGGMGQGGGMGRDR